jgi:hypothetical protein
MLTPYLTALHSHCTAFSTTYSYFQGGKGKPPGAFSLPVVCGVLFAMAGMVLFTIGLKVVYAPLYSTHHTLYTLGRLSSHHTLYTYVYSTASMLYSTHHTLYTHYTPTIQYGLDALAEDIGAIIPAAFTHVDTMKASPIYSKVGRVQLQHRQCSRSITM